jgi:hypothetical protein
MNLAGCDERSGSLHYQCDTRSWIRMTVRQHGLGSCRWSVRLALEQTSRQCKSEYFPKLWIAQTLEEVAPTAVKHSLRCRVGSTDWCVLSGAHHSLAELMKWST